MTDTTQPAAMTMVERMARAIHDALYRDEDSGAWMSGKCPLESVTIDGDVDLLKAARAALSAMMDATPGMIAAHDAAHAGAETVFAHPRKVWQAMVSAALDEGEG